MSADKSHVLWFDQPAKAYVEAIPMGNGRLGAMFFGNPVSERIVLNEATMWSGGICDYDRPEAYKVFETLKKLLLAGRNREAEELYESSFTSVLTPEEEYAGAASTYGCYQVLGCLHLSMHQNISSGQYCWYPQWSDGENKYYRRLNMKTAVMDMEYDADGVRFCREAFVSYPDQAVVLRLTASQRGKISFSARLDRTEHFKTCSSGSCQLLMTGQLENGNGAGIKYACRLEAECRGGAVYTEDGLLCVRGADEAILRLCAATNMRSFQTPIYDDPEQSTDKMMENIRTASWETLKSRHIKDYQKYYSRTDFELDDIPDSKLPVPAQLMALSRDEGSIKPLIPLFFNFGKYLYISAQREGGLPSNLQGIWAEEIQTMFNGDWHLDAQQENHWMAETLDFPGLHETYLQMIAFIERYGRRTAQKYYHARGWIAHIFTNPWGFTSPGARAFYGAFMGGSGWLCQHLWEHYLFHPDFKYLQWAYPKMTGAARFYLDVLFEEPEHGWLVTGPTTSPENSFVTEDGCKVSLCLGAACDTQIIRYLFTACIQAARLLQTDAPLVKELENALKRLPPTRIGPDGKIMEWLKPYMHYPHRHISHLWGLYPGNEITPEQTPKLAAAARKVIADKTAATGGWALAHRMNACARLYDGDGAELFLKDMLAHSLFPNMLGKCHQIIEDGKPHPWPDFEEYRVPFQIDGNYACTAGIVEMLLQSHEQRRLPDDSVLQVIHILPALPKSWSGGRIRGVRARQGLGVSIEWRRHELSHLEITGSIETDILLKYGGVECKYSIKPGRRYVVCGKDIRGLNGAEGC